MSRDRAKISNQKSKILPELLAPAGSFEKLVTAVHYGADAVYLGSGRYSLRAHAANFEDRELAEAVAYARERGVKVYVTVNILAHDADLPGLEEYLRFLADLRVDGLIVADPGVLRMARVLVPHIPVHLSTQANVTNRESARFWLGQGVSRLNLARELTLAEIAGIKQATGSEVEVFVHGALCISYSGRCLLSAYLTGRDANRGACSQPCRYLYTLMEEKRPGQFFPVEEDGRGTYIFNSRDLCLVARLPELIAAGVDAFKIEGRMKGIYYVGSVVRVYRAALDYLEERLAGPAPDVPASLPPVFLEELHKVGTRELTENFFDGPPGAAAMIYGSPRAGQPYVLAGVVRESGSSPRIEARNPIRPGDRLEYLGPGIETRTLEVRRLIGRQGEELAQANPGAEVILETMAPAPSVRANGLLRKLVDAS